MKNNSQNKFYWLYLTGIFLILALPLLSIAPWFHPAAWGKSIVFRIIFSILIFFSIWEILFKKEVSKVFKDAIQRISTVKIPFWVLTSLFGIFALATIFSLNPSFSFFGSPYRAGGFLTLGLLIIFAIFLFLVIKKKDWQKLLDFTILIGAMAALLGIFQKFGLLSHYLMPYQSQVISTMGGPMFFALYEILLIFLALTFGIIAKGKKKIFYFSAFIIIFIGILLAASRSIFFGLAIGFPFFIFFYPVKSDKVGISPKAKLFNWVNPLKNISDKKHIKKIILVKILTGILLILGVLGIFWLKTQPQTVQSLKENRTFGTTFARTWSIIGESNIPQYIMRSRGNSWEMLSKGIKDRPLLGYGPENLSVAFDKYYDPALLGIKSGTGAEGKWWDRGHNFAFDISISAGIPALIIYLLLFGVILWQLQRIKKHQRQSAIIGGNQNSIIAHGLQATFIGYLTANFFNFDVFSTYLIFFLLIAYSFHLISSSKENNININQEKLVSEYSEPKPWKYIFIFILCLLLVWFILSYNIKPLQVNKGVNRVVALREKAKSLAKENPEAIKKAYPNILEKADGLLNSGTFIENYLRLQYIDTISAGTEIMPEKKLALSQKAVEILEKCVELRPNYTRSWLYLAIFSNRILESNSNLTPEQKIDLNQKINFWLEKALQLSPKRPDIFLVWTKNCLTNKEYQKAEEKADQCLEADPGHGDCLWAKSLALASLGKIEESSMYMEKAAKDGYRTEAKSALGQLVKVYSNLAKDTGEITYYEILIGFYQKLIKLDYNNFQYHASLAYAYGIVGDYDKSREEAAIVLKLSPESKANVDEFLKTLPR